MNLKLVKEIQGDDAFSNLPKDIFFEILSRVPIKTISESARWVNKTWYDIFVHNRLFAQLHYAKALQTKSVSVIFNGYSDIFHLIDHQLLDNFEISVPIYPLEFKELRENFTNSLIGIGYQVVGSVNGLICFSPGFHRQYKPDPFYICNPIIRDYLVLPKSPKIDGVPIAAGFGFDSINNEYKVIRVLPKEKTEYEAEEVVTGNQIELYTLGSESWRVMSTNLPYITHMITQSQSAVLVNGCLNWICYTDATSSCSPIILSFNVATEEFNIIELPSQLCPNKLKMVKSLMVLEECLCFTVGPRFGPKTIWKMKDYGLQNSWDMESTVDNIYGFWICYEVVELRNGELMLPIRNKLGYYDLGNKTFKPIKILNNGHGIVGINIPIFVVASLLSPRNVGNYETLNREDNFG